MTAPDRRLLSGNEAVALAARDAQVALGTGYPGTPATEILEALHAFGGRAQWAPNEKVALEVGIGAAFGGARVLVAMKHVGLNVAADPFFSAAYTGVDGALVVVSADDPGMASSQSEQDNRHYAVAAGVPMLEPADSQEAYDFTARAVEISERWNIPVLLRLTTRICHSKSIVRRRDLPGPTRPRSFEKNVQRRVMIPPHARPAHRLLRQKLSSISEWNEESDLNPAIAGSAAPAIITSGISTMHVREAALGAAVLKLGMTYPMPMDAIWRFVDGVGRCTVIEEGDPYLATYIRAAGIVVADKPEAFRFGELNVDRVRAILRGETQDAPAGPAGRPAQLCPGCPHRKTFEVLRDLDCIVIGDIGCYTLGALPPYQALETQLCMGASIGMGLGLRHVLPEAQARRVVSVVGDSTFIHSGITGVVEMAYNTPPTGHVVVVMDNGITAMTGLQDHPATGLRLDGTPATRASIEDLARAAGVSQVEVIDPVRETERFREAMRAAMSGNRTTVIVARHPCVLAAKKARRVAKEAEADGQ